MTSYEKIWDIAEDNHGVITSEMARSVGVKAAALVSMSENGKLVHLGHGVYKLEHHATGQYDEYAQAVAFVGKTGFIRGASALMIRGLVPFDPFRMYLGVSRRFRKHLPTGYEVRFVANPSLEHIEGIPVQTVAEAIADAKECGAMDIDRIAVSGLKSGTTRLAMQTRRRCVQFRQIYPSSLPPCSSRHQRHFR